LYHWIIVFSYFAQLHNRVKEEERRKKEDDQEEQEDN